MDALTFTSEVIGSLAWPVATIIIVWMLRNPIADVLRLIRKLSYRELNVEFGAELDQAKEAAEAVLPPRSPDRPPLPERVNRFLAIAAVSPAAAIAEAWREVETALLDAAKRHGLEDRGIPWALRAAQSELVNWQTIDADHAAILNRLRMLRNRAVHDHEYARAITAAEAIEFAGLADRLVEYLNGI